MSNPRRAAVFTAEDIEDSFNDSLKLLRSVRRTLSALLERVEDGESGLLKEVGLKSSELETALKRAFEAEEKYNAWHAKHSGFTQACEIDFASLRQEIACRLQRLTDCCDEG